MSAVPVRQLIGCAALALMACASLLFPVPAQAGVVMYGTRVIYPAGQDYVMVRFANRDRAPNLMQVWVDDGAGAPAEDEASAPFFVNPPLFRINADSQQTVRVMFNRAGAALPEDRETLYWLNFLQIPPSGASGQSSAAGAAAKLTLSFLNQVKLIYRPSAIEGRVDDLPKNLRFSIRKGAKETRLVAENPTGFYATFTEKAAVNAGGAAGAVQFDKKVTLAPFSSLDWKISGIQTLSWPASVAFSLIDDKGNARKYVSDIHP